MIALKRLYHRLWHSPTVMTWLNTSVRVLSLGFVLPLVLRTFTPEDISLYYLFASIVAFQLMSGAGFNPAFARFISFVLAGRTLKDLANLTIEKCASPPDSGFDADLLTRLLGTIRRIFTVVSLASLPLIAIVGTFFLLRPISTSSNPTHAWFAWVLVILVTPLTIYSSQFSVVLQGTNRIAMEQRWSAAFILVSMIAGLIALLCGGRLLALVAANQLGQIVTYFRLSWLSKRTLEEVSPGGTPQFCPQVFRVIWPSSWRSLVGGISSTATTTLSGLFFAQRIGGAALAEFLLAVRIMSIVSEISRAPFYSKIPSLNFLRAKGDLTALQQNAGRGMRFAYTSFMGLYFLVPLAAAVVFPLIHSNISFAPLTFWSLLGFAALIERFGAMHLQFYSTTNHIIWHWVNPVTGLIWIGITLLLIPRAGICAYPIGMLCAYGCYFCPVAVRRSLSAMQRSFWEFERFCFIPALASFAGATVLLAVIFSLT